MDGHRADCWSVLYAKFGITDAADFSLACAPVGLSHLSDLYAVACGGRYSAILRERGASPLPASKRSSRRFLLGLHSCARARKASSLTARPTSPAQPFPWCSVQGTHRRRRQRAQCPAVQTCFSYLSHRFCSPRVKSRGLTSTSSTCSCSNPTAHRVYSGLYEAGAQKDSAVMLASQNLETSTFPHRGADPAPCFPSHP